MCVSIYVYIHTHIITSSPSVTTGGAITLAPCASPYPSERFNNPQVMTVVAVAVTFLMIGICSCCKQQQVASDE